MNILLVRHGQTDENALGILQGHRDTRLNAIGVAQAAALAERLATFEPRIEALVTSDLSRAAETARAIAVAIGATPAADEAWRERAFGAFEGRTLSEADVWRAAAGTSDLPGAELAGVFRARVKRALLAIPERFSGCHTVAVATHGGPMRAVLMLLSEGELRLADNECPPDVVPIANASIMHLVAESGPDRTVRWRLRGVNDVEHLRLASLASPREIPQE